MHKLTLLIGLSFLLLGFFSKGHPILQQSCLGVIFLGYTLFLDSLCFFWKKPSLISYSFRKMIALFLFSLGFWVFFSTINIQWKLWSNTQMPSDILSFISYWIYHSALFPAFFVTRYWLYPKKEKHIERKEVSPMWAIIGLFSLILPFIDVLFYPLFFVAPFLLLDWMNAQEQRPSVLMQWQSNRFHLSFIIGVSGLFLGLLYEFINFYYGPFWNYRFAFGFGPKIFGMNLSGYFGYFFFGFDLYAAGIFSMSLISNQKRFLF